MDLRLEDRINQREWEALLQILKPKYFPRDEKGCLVPLRNVALIADALINPEVEAPDKVKIVLMKCLVNCCVNGYEHLEYELATPSVDDDNFYAEFQKMLPSSSRNERTYLSESSFPYEGVIKWSVNYISNSSITDNDLSEERLELLRLSLQFSCNTCKVSFQYVQDERFKESTVELVRHHRLPISKAASAFVHNALTCFGDNYYNENTTNRLAVALMTPMKLGILPALDAVAHLLKEPKRLQIIYEQIPINERLYLLENIHQELRDVSSLDEKRNFTVHLTSELVLYLAERFRRKSDLILKTVTSYLDGTEPMEIMILLDIIGVLTSESSTELSFVNDLRNDKSLLINCVFLLKSLQMVGKDSENYFTPVQKLSQLAPCISELGPVDDENCTMANDIQAHPAFGFKVGLIRVIGNMVYNHEANQDLVRETEGIPLLLDCCNMDARNPLIMQWTIFAMRNICHRNSANQEIVRGLTKIGVADSATL